MTCPTCSKTMHAIAAGVYHCPVCGTLVRAFFTSRTDVDVPALVGRCRLFARRFRADEDAALIAAWESLGIDEAIRTEAERTTETYGS